MKIIPYLCRAERQVLAKAYASSLDLNLNATSSGIQVCRTSKPRLCVSSFCGTMQNVNRSSIAFSLVSSKSVRLISICLLI